MKLKAVDAPHGDATRMSRSRRGTCPRSPGRRGAGPVTATHRERLSMSTAEHGSTLISPGVPIRRHPRRPIVPVHQPRDWDSSLTTCADRCPRTVGPACGWPRPRPSPRPTPGGPRNALVDLTRGPPVQMDDVDRPRLDVSVHIARPPTIDDRHCEPYDFIRCKSTDHVTSLKFVEADPGSNRSRSRLIRRFRPTSSASEQRATVPADDA